MVSFTGSTKKKKNAFSTKAIRGLNVGMAFGEGQTGQKSGVLLLLGVKRTSKTHKTRETSHERMVGEGATRGKYKKRVENSFRPGPCAKPRNVQTHMWGMNA